MLDGLLQEKPLMNAVCFFDGDVGHVSCRLSQSAKLICMLLKATRRNMKKNEEWDFIFILILSFANIQVR